MLSRAASLYLPCSAGGGRERWGGLLKDGEEQAEGCLLFGENRMGRALMWVRDVVRRRGSAGQGA